MLQKPVIDRTICVAQIEGYEGPYGYQPSLAAGIVFCTLFSLSMFAHLFATIRYRVWWQLLFAIGCLTELIGWAGRTWSQDCPYETNPFLMQITTLIIAPAFFTAGIYVVLGRLIHAFGEHTSPISPKLYLYIFCTIDIISLVIQAVGGASASVAYEKTPPGNTSTGTHIMVAGILFQLAGISIFSVLFAWVMNKAIRTRKDLMAKPKIKAIVYATILSVLAIIIRSIYRTIELLQGWTGYLITTERFFIALDGAMMIIAVGVYNFAQPRWASPQNMRPKVTAESSLMELGDQTKDVGARGTETWPA